MREFPNRFETENAWQNEPEARRLLSPDGGPDVGPDGEGDIASIKVRPISSDGWDAYVYDNEYNEIRSTLGPAKLRGQLGAGRFENAGLYEADGEVFLVAEHETGPELVAYLALIAAGVGLAKELVGLLKTIIETVSKHAELKKVNEASPEASAPASPGERFYGAEAVSVEVRTKLGSRRVYCYELAADTPINEMELLAAVQSQLRARPGVARR